MIKKTQWLFSIILGTVFCSISAAQDNAIPDSKFRELHDLIKPQTGESRWMEITWYPSVWEARQKAAAEGKPLFIMAGSGGAPVAGC